MATTQQKLDEAQAAYHKLMTGLSARVVVDGSTGERVEFTAINAPKLYAYIQALQAQLNTELGVVTTPCSSGPLQFLF